MRKSHFFSTLTVLFLSLFLSTVLADSPSEGGEGKFTFEMKKYDDAPTAALYDELQKDGSFAKATDHFNELLNLPVNINIFFDKSDLGPYYLHGKGITMDYGIFELSEVLFHKNYPDEDKAAEFEYAVNVNRFFLYHELGHALIDVYHLPLVGDEETTADNLAAMFALEFTDKGWDIVIDASDFFDLLRKARENSQLEDAYWDEHRMDSQRYYYILCMAYGKYPEETKKELASYKDADLDEFIKEKGDQCKYEYQNALVKWKQLLDSHLKTKMGE